LGGSKTERKGGKKRSTYPKNRKGGRKMQAYIHSLKVTGTRPEDEHHVMGEVEKIERINGNEYVATYKGKRYSTIYNPFVGAYFVDDVYGGL
jgi:hypothetical protein